MLELNCEGLMDKTTGGIIQCFRAWVDLEHGWIQDLK